MENFLNVYSLIKERQDTYERIYNSEYDESYCSVLSDEIRILSALQKCQHIIGSLEAIKGSYYIPKKESQSPLENAYFWACHAPSFIQKGKLGKANRWLGFVQGVLFTLGFLTFEELKIMNRRRK